MESLLGKRKDREEEPKVHGPTLFVSNLPYTATSTDLKTLFSDLAPVRSAFVVLDPGSGASKGVGYVSFAIREDAQLAFDKITNEGIVLDGRSLRVQWADSKNKDRTHEEQPKKKDARTSTPRFQQGTSPRDPLAIRTVVIAGLPSSIDSKTLWKKIRKLGGAEKIEWPIVSEEGNEDRNTAHALFASPAAASEAVNKLHAHVFKGSLLSATLKKRLDGLAKVPKRPQATAAAPKLKGLAPSRASRLIVRNLPFNMTEQDLRAMFLPYGPIYSIDIPTVAEGANEAEGASGKKPRTKGFAFVWMLSRKDAEKAMEGCNGMTVQPGMAERMVSDKQKRKKQRREEKKLSKAAVKEDEDEGEINGDEENEERSRNQRVIAVDWALSKDKWEKEKARMETESGKNEDDEISDLDNAADSNDDEGNEAASSKSGENGELGVHDDSSDDEEQDDSDGDLSDEEMHGDGEERTKPSLPPPETGTTVFVRNVPFEATEDELRTLFRTFGPLRYARITIDPVTERSRGTGFVCFWNKTDADKAVEQSETLRTETIGDTAATLKKNPFKLPSLLTPDPSASIAQNLVLHGRTLDVIRAVTRDEAGKLKEAGERQREKADKRNLYLLREGIILPNTPAAESLSTTEVEKRTQSYNARRALLRSNPSLYVSRTRLSIRQLPLFVTERMLKRLAIHAVRTFEKEVEEGIRQRLTDDELAEAASAADHEEMKKEPGSEKKSKKDTKRKGGRDTGVKQAKIVRQADRVDSVTGKGRSRGYGFLEMATHANALRVLRWANNNFEVGALFEGWWKVELEGLVKIEKKKDVKDESRLKRLKEELEKGTPVKSKGTLIVEFSIENVQVVQRRAAHQREKSQVRCRFGYV
ncbi:hypothetical protein AcW1_009926 [Taiwanofungus camphoratus]|nr:hypothetical protein AcV5_003238 [Antrodia cinnamomea]KAI0929425.1 hypothetical protein AcV7_005278 [Antrodia cinnamomea]KAI0946475.1 hypothetical protein AcW1_009926 [Antrodia cinnamomea]